MLASCLHQQARLPSYPLFDRSSICLFVYLFTAVEEDDCGEEHTEVARNDAPSSAPLSALLPLVLPLSFPVSALFVSLSSSRPSPYSGSSSGWPRTPRKW
eukprot:GHVU01085601.1.p1 GENE.GHVU01085601.1~~GHVU01085601.1.p1  ORF type:complete len:100 (+),score=5.77 GHVU01085601.1:30-329(+)